LFEHWCFPLCERGLSGDTLRFVPGSLCGTPSRCNEFGFRVGFDQLFFQFVQVIDH